MSVLFYINTEKSALFGSKSVKVSVLLDVNSKKVSLLFGSNSVKVPVLLGMKSESVSIVWQ